MKSITRSAMLGVALLTGACASNPSETPPAQPVALSAAPALDRSSAPEPGPAPSVHLPAVQTRTLSNGLRVLVVERPELPLVTLRLVIGAGSVAEQPGQAGLASLTATMLDEGTRTRSALEIADEFDFLAAQFGAGAGYDAATFDLNTLTRHLPAALEVFADVLTSPAFDSTEFERVRRDRLTDILRARDQPVTVANDAFAQRIFGEGHPYGRPLIGTERSVSAVTTVDLRRFYTTYYRPNNAQLIVAGDVEADALVPMLERALGSWQRGVVPAVVYPEPPAAPSASRVFLIDKPGAAQSEIRVGHLSVARDNPDYFPLLVLNTILGGQFSSRINLNLREDKGYTYGARSAFNWRRAAGPFVAQAGVQTPATRESVIEFMRELEEIREGRPVTEQELEFAKASLVRREPLTLETQGQLVGRLEELVLYDLPLGYFDDYTERVQAVTREDVNRVAREYLHPSRVAIVVVGDRAVVEEGLRQLPYPLEVVSTEAAEDGR